MEKWIEDLIGVPYVEYGNTPEEGFHCSGLVRYVLNRAYKINLPTDPLAWRKQFQDVPWPGPLQDYDVVLMKGEFDSHIGVVVGGDVLHSWKPAGGVNLIRLEWLAPVIEEVGRFKG
jgi:cell wall-associated NlpC family hydrolase